MHFRSLLPNNFNNFIFQFSNNANIYDSISTVNREGLMDNKDVTNQIKSWIDGRIKDAETLVDLDKKIKEAKKTIDETNPDDDNYTEAGKEYYDACVAYDE
jgi:hypothetical protein